MRLPGWFRRWQQRRREAEARRNACPAGGVHDWEQFTVMDPMSFGAVIEGFQCRKCNESSY